MLDQDGGYRNHTDIVIRDGKIRRIGEALGTEPGREPEEIIDCTELVVTPGIPNLHSHVAMAVFRGIAEDVDSNSWFNEYIWPYESKMTPGDVRLGALLGIAEMLNNGVTAFCDHYFEEQQVLDAVLSTGIRADIAPTIFGSAPNYGDRLSEVCAFIEKNRDASDRIELRMGPHAQYTCPDPTLKEIIAAAKALKVGIHLHVSEEKAQVEATKKAFGKTPFEIIADAGGFDVPCLVAHGTWLEDGDLEFINGNTWFAQCPKTYMKLSSGEGNIYRLKDRLQYAFGTDGAASSNTLNPVEQARLFALIGKYNGGDPVKYPAKEMWRTLMRGHRAMNFRSGRIEAGWNADLVIWDLNRPNTFPVYDPMSSILYSSDSGNVSYTIVGGTILKRNGVLEMDGKSLIEKARKAQRALLERGKGRAAVVY